MGVHGLWELLAPVGRRVSVETLAGKKLAIDASIWMVQFMKAMRDDQGEMVRNAHLLGFFRRICKLMFLRTKPIFVFDGGTPVLKRRTVIARRRQRENAQAKIRKTAEKLLLNHLKAMKLKELAKDLENERQKGADESKKGFTSKIDVMLRNSEKNDLLSGNQEKLNGMLGTSIALDKDETLLNYASTCAEGIHSTRRDDNEDEITLLKEEKVKEPVKCMENQKQMDDGKGKNICTGASDTVTIDSSEKDDTIWRSSNQELLDEMLAASIAAEEDHCLTNNASTSATAVLSEEDDSNEDEEIILPTMHGSFDPAVLAALPPSMQLDLLVQMREQLMAENRQKYQKVKKVPADFSALQVQSYLKTVAFRREIDDVQKSAAGIGVGGVQTSRIASEANREFIFSSSFTGDKQVLASAGEERRGDKHHQTPKERSSSDVVNNIACNGKLGTVTGSVQAESRQLFDEDVETYVDERGRLRVSRVRAMGIRMTRDLQRNLDLMKEIEHERITSTITTEPMLSSNSIDLPSSFPSKKMSDTIQRNCETVDSYKRIEDSTHKNESRLEISFEDDGKKNCLDDDDDLFASLVAADQVTTSANENILSRKQSSNTDSDCDWEETIIEQKGTGVTSDVGEDTECPLKEGSPDYESEVQREEDVHDFPKIIPGYPSESVRTVSKGSLEEQADLQEAIKRSLDDLSCGESVNPLLESQKILKSNTEEVNDGIRSLAGESPHLVELDVNQIIDSSCKIVDGFEKTNLKILGTIDSSEFHVVNSVSQNVGDKDSYFEQLCENEGEDRGMANANPVILSERKVVNLSMQQPLNVSEEGVSLSIHADKFLEENKVSDAVPNDFPDPILVGIKKIEFEPSNHLVMSKPTKPLVESSTKEHVNQFVFEQKLIAEKEQFGPGSSEHSGEKSASNDREKVHAAVEEVNLEEELLILDQERINLGHEQRKLERNAESVCSEMFAECQELLQMFGLPYIIAPMEAEAQCAYLELENLVDGVVTDDSDVFLFGAKSVYKNIFDDRKYVETYLMKDIENELGLSREKLIRMALLLGSDYTEGISGIGIVNAIEVVNAFPEEDGLCKFREWIESPDPAILGKLDAHAGSRSRKRGSKVSESNENHTKSSAEVLDENIEAHELKQSLDGSQGIKQIFMDKHRNVSKNWHIPLSFPSEAVLSAYSSPQVDKSTEAFSWGKPDLSVLRKLCWEKFGWRIQKADELLLPVLKEYSKHETQLRLEAFYSFNERFAKIRSKRINKAVKGITGSRSLDVMGVTTQKVSSSISRSVNSSERCNKNSENLVTEGTDSKDRSTATTQSRKRKIHRTPSEAEDPSENRKGRSRGRGRGRGRGRSGGVGSGRSKGDSSPEICGTSYDNSKSDDEQVNCVELEVSHELRRSARSRKHVNYTAVDFEIDNGGHLSDQNDEKCSNEEAVAQKPSGSPRKFVDTTGATDERKHHRKGESIVQEEIYIDDDVLCMDGGAIGKQGVSKSDFESEFSKDYLQIGGGFCMDEGETNENQEGSCVSPTAAFLENADPFHHAGSTDNADFNITSAQSIATPETNANETEEVRRQCTPEAEKNLEHLTVSSNEDNPRGHVYQENAKVDAATSVGSLSAMPFLRRKRKR